MEAGVFKNFARTDPIQKVGGDTVMQIKIDTTGLRHAADTLDEVGLAKNNGPLPLLHYVQRCIPGRAGSNRLHRLASNAVMG